MAVFSSITQAQVVQLVQQRLLALRAALDGVNDLFGWTSGVSAADLVTLGFSQADAGQILSAVADAHAEYLVHTTGQAPSTYPQVTGTPYVYAASQRLVLGPQ